MKPPIVPRHMLLRHPPGEHRHLGKSVALSMLAHVLFGALVCGAAYWFSSVTLKNLLAVNPSLPATGPAPEQTMTVEFLAPAPTPPRTPLPLQPTSPYPTIVQQEPKPATTPPRKPEHPKTLAKITKKPKRAHTAPDANGAGLTPSIVSAHTGWPGLPRPDYPPEAFYHREGGTVSMRVVFGPNGAVQTAEVRQTSGFGILDNYTRSFIHAHWKNANYANTTIDIPIIYDPSKIITSDAP